MARDLAVVLSGGSVNSAVTATLALQKYRVILVHAQMPTPDAPARLAAHLRLGEQLRAYRQVLVPLPGIEEEEKSTGGGATETPTPAFMAARLRPLIPLLGIATHVALTYEASAIYCGLRVGSDASFLTDAIQFQQIYAELLQLSVGGSLPELQFPLTEMELHQVVDLGTQIHAPFDATWSCHGPGPHPCGECSGCRHRLIAFAQTQVADPLSMQK